MDELLLEAIEKLILEARRMARRPAERFILDDVADRVTWLAANIQNPPPCLAQEIEIAARHVFGYASALDALEHVAVILEEYCAAPYDAWHG